MEGEKAATQLDSDVSSNAVSDSLPTATDNPCADPEAVAGPSGISGHKAGSLPPDSSMGIPLSNTSPPAQRSARSTRGVLPGRLKDTDYVETRVKALLNARDVL